MPRLSPYELDKMARAISPEHRVYEWRHVEEMRESLAAVAKEQSWSAADLDKADAMKAEISRIWAELRAEGNFALADRLRAAAGLYQRARPAKK